MQLPRKKICTTNACLAQENYKQKESIQREWSVMKALNEPAHYGNSEKFTAEGLAKNTFVIKICLTFIEIHQLKFVNSLTAWAGRAFSLKGISMS